MVSEGQALGVTLSSHSPFPTYKCKNHIFLMRRRSDELISGWNVYNLFGKGPLYIQEFSFPLCLILVSDLQGCSRKLHGSNGQEFTAEVVFKRTVKLKATSHQERCLGGTSAVSHRNSQFWSKPRTPRAHIDHASVLRSVARREEY